MKKRDYDMEKRYYEKEVYPEEFQKIWRMNTPTSGVSKKIASLTFYKSVLRYLEIISNQKIKKIKDLKL